jgi:phenylacetate-CoA ligase
MVTVRGVNVYPGALDNIIRAHSSVVEYEAHIRTHRAMHELVLKVEVGGDDVKETVETLASNIHNRLQLRPTIEVVEAGSLPRYDLKSLRFRVHVDEGDTSTK